jgi:hypothetical protein
MRLTKVSLALVTLLMLGLATTSGAQAGYVWSDFLPFFPW